MSLFGVKDTERLLGAVWDRADTENWSNERRDIEWQSAYQALRILQQVYLKNQLSKDEYHASLQRLIDQYSTTPHTAKKPSFVKKLGHWGLLWIVHLAIYFFGSLVLSLLFGLLVETDLGARFVWDLTGGIPEYAIAFFPCIFSYIACTSLASRFCACGPLRALGIVIVVSNIIFFVSNLSGDGSLIASVVKIVFGIIFIATAKKYK